MMALDTLRPALARYPLVRCGGAARERGHQYGLQARDRIHNTLASYRDLFLAYAELDWNSVTSYACRYGPIIQAHDAQLLEELRGIAEGAGVEYEDILAVNVRTEVMYGLGELRAAAECTAFAALPEATAGGHTILGQNWDWHPAAFDSCVVLAIDQADRPSLVTVVEAGLLAKMGMNSCGVGLATNALVSDVDSGEPGIPYHVLLRGILDSPSFEAARSLVRSVRRASSANYLIASKEGRAVDLETAPGDGDHVFALDPDEGVVGHANCFVAPSVTVEDQTPLKKPLGMTRQHTIDRFLQGRRGSISVDMMQLAFTDHEHHPNSLCRHPVETLAPIDRSATVASVIMDLDESAFWVADGQPCSHPYRRFTAADLWDTAAERQEIELSEMRVGDGG